MSKTSIDEAYEAGVNAGKNAGNMDQFTHNLSNWEYSARDKAYNDGWKYGVEHKNDSNDSDYSSEGSGSTGGGCFITTATLTSIGKSDDCMELNIFRNYRDQWLAKQDDGVGLIKEYYNIAPKIVLAINKLPTCKSIYMGLWENELEPCLRLIRDEQFERAKLLYCNVVMRLKQEYLTV